MDPILPRLERNPKSGKRFSEKLRDKQNLEHDRDSKKRDHALAAPRDGCHSIRRNA